METPADAARKLRELGLLTEDEAALLRKVISFRNIVVHGYLRVDLSVVEKMLRERTYREVLIIAEKVCARSGICLEDP